MLSSTTSYVLLAANIEDFRTLAKQFVPDHMADEILEMAKDAIGRDSTKTPRPYPEHRSEEQTDDDAQESNTSLVAVRSAYKHKKGNMAKSSKRPITKYELSLDDLVEKVKERLQSELTQMAVTAAKKKILLQSKEKKNKRKLPNLPVPPNDSFDGPAPDQPGNYKIFPSRFIENIRNKPREKENREEKPKRQTDDKKYVAEMFVAQPPKYLYNLGKPVTLQQTLSTRPKKVTPQQNVASRPERNKVPYNQHQVTNNQNIKRERKIIRPKHITTPQNVDSFIGVDMVQRNDSYEDYVVPKKDNYYYEPETGTKHKTVKKVLEDFSDEFEATTKAKKNVNFEDEAINHKNNNKSVETIHNNDDNKYFKQRLSNKEPERPIVPLAAGNTEQRIQPYAEQLKDTAYADETEEPVTEELKARSARISLNEYTISQYLSPHVVKHIEGNKNKKNKKPGQATVIPKRDIAYKLSSPNYLVEIPIVGEKYRFDEPIPEQDREPENLDPVDNPQGLINGKLLV